MSGANKGEIGGEMPRIGWRMCGAGEEVPEGAGTGVSGNGSAEFRVAETRLGNGQIVIDLVRAFGNRVSDGAHYEGICW